MLDNRKAPRNTGDIFDNASNTEGLNSQNDHIDQTNPMQATSVYEVISDLLTLVMQRYASHSDKNAKLGLVLDYMQLKSEEFSPDSDRFEIPF